MTLPEPNDILDAALGRCPGAAPDIEKAIRDGTAFLAAFAGAERAVRGRDLRLTAEEAETLRQVGLGAAEMLAPGELLRLRLLLARIAILPAGEHPALVSELLRRGDDVEKQAVLKALPLLPGPERFRDVALLALRSAVAGTVAAIACDNDYPLRYFPPDSFRAMVLKALHLGIPLRRIRGLDARRDEELARMGRAYASEQRAALRPVSPDVALLTGEAP